MRITEDSFVEDCPGQDLQVPEGSRDAPAARTCLGGSLDNAIVLGETGVLNNALGSRTSSSATRSWM